MRSQYQNLTELYFYLVGDGSKHPSQLCPPVWPFCDWTTDDIPHIAATPSRIYHSPNQSYLHISHYKFYCRVLLASN